jgi:hypothetical protein
MAIIIVGCARKIKQHVASYGNVIMQSITYQASSQVS